MKPLQSALTEVSLTGWQEPSALSCSKSGVMYPREWTREYFSRVQGSSRHAEVTVLKTPAFGQTEARCREGACEHTARWGSAGWVQALCPRPALGPPSARAAMGTGRPCLAELRPRAGLSLGKKPPPLTTQWSFFLSLPKAKDIHGQLPAPEMAS